MAEVAGDAAGGRRLLEPPAFHPEHLDQLAATGYRGGQGLRRRVGDRPRGRLHAGAEVGEHGSVDGISLGSATERLGEGPDLPGIDDRHRQAGGGARRNDRALIAAGRFDDDDRRREGAKAGDQRGRGPPAWCRSSIESPVGATATTKATLLTSIPTLNVSMVDSSGRGSRPYASAGSGPYQLSGMNDAPTRKSAHAVIRCVHQENDGLLFRAEFYQIGKT